MIIIILTSVQLTIYSFRYQWSSYTRPNNCKIINISNKLIIEAGILFDLKYMFVLFPHTYKWNWTFVGKKTQCKINDAKQTWSREVDLMGFFGFSPEPYVANNIVKSNSEVL